MTQSSISAGIQGASEGHNLRSVKPETIFIIGAGFSRHAGLPVTTGFTSAILEARDRHPGPSRIAVDFLSHFISAAFHRSKVAGARWWPELEDLLTCVDLSANSGHYLGTGFPAADLRTVRRVILASTIRMLNSKYDEGRRKKGRSEWQMLERFFASIDPGRVGFINMNWDTVVERQLLISHSSASIEYGCDAQKAGIPDLPNLDDYSNERKYLKKLREGLTITLDHRRPNEDSLVTPLVKIHGSANWLYCDNCRRLFWVPPDQSNWVADQLITERDLSCIERHLRRKRDFKPVIEKLRQRPRVKCFCSDNVDLSTRIATFSYRKSLDFSMFQKSWFEAEQLLMDAERWIFIGYSLPPADYEFKYLLKRTQLCRSKSPQFIVVSGGGRSAVARTRENYQRFFGNRIRKSDFFVHGLSDDAFKAIFR
jgi:hypothetical protein